MTSDSPEGESAKSGPSRSIADPDIQRAVETTLAPNLQRLPPQERQHVIQEVTMASTEPRTVPFSIRLDTRAKTALDKQAAAQFNVLLEDLIERIANADARPSWKPNSFFRRYVAN